MTAWIENCGCSKSNDFHKNSYGDKKLDAQKKSL